MEAAQVSWRPKAVLMELYPQDWPSSGVEHANKRRRVSHAADTIFSRDSLKFCSAVVNFPEISSMSAEKSFIRLVEEKAGSVMRLMKKEKIEKNNMTYWNKYAEWCEIHHDKDYSLSGQEKIVEFLEFCAELYCENFDERTAGSKKRVMEGDIQTGVVTTIRRGITALNHLRDWQNALEGQPKITDMEYIKNLKERNWAKKNDATRIPSDPAARSRLHVFNLQEAERDSLVDNLWNGKCAESYTTKVAADRAQMRMTLEHNLNITSGQRGQNVRAYRYCEFSEFYLPKIKPMPCRGITASIWHKKQNAENVEHRASWVRNSNRLECGVGSFADYIVYSVDISKTLPLFDVMKTDLLNILNWHHTGRVGAEPVSKWHSMYVFANPLDNTKQISYETHLNDVNNGFEASSISGKRSKTHILRNITGVDLIQSGLPVDDTTMYMGWTENTGTKLYLRGAIHSLPVLASAGYDTDLKSYFCYWQGDAKDIPETLKQAVLPGLDELVTLSELVYQTAEVDLSAKVFCKCLVFLRDVYLQDSVYKRALYPDFPAYRHKVFDLPDYQIFKAQEELRVKCRESGETPSKALLEFVKPPVMILKKPYEDPPYFAEPLSLKITYEEWESMREYYAVHDTKKTQWARSYGKKLADSIGPRFGFIKPFVKLVDKLINEGQEKEDVLEKFEIVRLKYNVTVSSFIKVCVYFLFHVPKKMKKLPPVDLDEFKQELINRNLW